MKCSTDNLMFEHLYPLYEVRRNSCVEYTSANCVCRPLCHRFVAWNRSLNVVERVRFSTLKDSLLDKYFQLSPLGALASRRTWRCLATKVGTTKNLPRLQRVKSTTFSWLGFSSSITGLGYILMNERKCRAPSHRASHVSSTNTAQRGCRSRTNTRISQL